MVYKFTSPRCLFYIKIGGGFIRYDPATNTITVSRMNLFFTFFQNGKSSTRTFFSFQIRSQDGTVRTYDARTGIVQL